MLGHLGSSKGMVREGKIKKTADVALSSDYLSINSCRMSNWYKGLGGLLTRKRDLLLLLEELFLKNSRQQGLRILYFCSLVLYKLGDDMSLF